MISLNELKSGLVITFENGLYKVLEAHHSHVGRGSASAQVRLKNLKTGSVVSRSFKSSDKFEEVETEREEVEYLYNHRGEYWFSEKDNRSKRFTLEEGLLENEKHFLKPNTSFEVLKFNDEVISLIIPIKMDLKVVEAPPNIRGNTVQGGTKIITLETGAKVSVPLFIEEGDVVRVNTESGEYVERVEKN